MMNFGTSINGRRARRFGRGPASWVAARIGHGLRAEWVARNCDACEWHHSQANLGGDGRPIDYYAIEAVAARWLAANIMHGRLDRARRLRGWRMDNGLSLAAETGEALREFARRGAPPVDPPAADQSLVGATITAVRRETTRQRSRRQRYTVEHYAIRATVLAASATMLTLRGWRENRYCWTRWEARVARTTLDRLSVVA